MRYFLPVAFALSLFAACSDDEPSAPPATSQGKADGQNNAECPSPDQRTVAATALRLNVETGRATAVIELDLTGCAGVELVAEGLNIEGVVDVYGAPLEWEIAPFSNAAGQFDTVLIPDATDILVVDYTFDVQKADSTEIAEVFSTLSWPHKCGRVMPCHTGPADGVLLSVDVEGLSEGVVAVSTPTLEQEASAYMAAVAIGPYQKLDIGVSDSGIEVFAWWLPLLGQGREASILEAMQPVVPALNWLETELGPYTFGKSLGAVEVDWGPGASLGGMEHHPYWHVDDGAMTDVETQIHELIHGWYGNGVRIACWEDFILSEGVTSYLTARVIGQVLGAEAEATVWADYGRDRRSWATTEAWRDGECTLFTVDGTDIWSLAPYRRGAFFLRTIADEVGAEVLDAALGSFYDLHVGHAARFMDLLEHIKDQTGFDAPALARETLL